MLPNILTGAAGRALRTLEPITANAKAIGAALDAGATFPNMPRALPLETIDASVFAAADDITRAVGPGIGRALTTSLRRDANSMELGIAAMGRARTTGMHAIAHRGTRTAVDGVQQSVDLLGTAASDTAQRRLTIAAGLGGATLLTAALAAQDGGGQQEPRIMAPGPLGVPNDDSRTPRA